MEHADTWGTAHALRGGCLRRKPEGKQVRRKPLQDEPPTVTIRAAALSVQFPHISDVAWTDLNSAFKTGKGFDRKTYRDLPWKGWLHTPRFRSVLTWNTVVHLGSFGSQTQDGTASRRSMNGISLFFCSMAICEVCTGMITRRGVAIDARHSYGNA